MSIKDKIVKYKIQKRNRLRRNLLLADPTRRKFWRFLKGQLKGAGNITAATDATGNMVFGQEQIEDVVLQHFKNIFKGSRVPIPPYTLEQTQVDEAINEIDAMLNEDPIPISHTKFENEVCAPYTFSEVEDILLKLPGGKACGYDKISNELLKNSRPIFKQYLQIFLNKILEEGLVPLTLNQGKCVLVHKVC